MNNILPVGLILQVRDIYDSGDYLVLVTTDRLSAFDRVLASIPFKGQVSCVVASIYLHLHVPREKRCSYRAYLSIIPMNSVN